MAFKPTIVLTFDAPYDSVYTATMPSSGKSAFTFLRDLGILGTLFIYPDWVPPTPNGVIMAETQIAAYRAIGWEIGAYIYDNGNDLRTYTQSQYTAVLQSIKTKMLSKFSLANSILLAQAPTQRKFNTNMEAWSQLLDVNGYPYYDSVRAVYVTDTSAPYPFEPFPIANRHYVNNGGATSLTSEGASAVTLADMKAMIDDLISQGEYLFVPVMHTIRINDVYGLHPADFEEWINYIVTKRDAGLLDVKTWSDAVANNEATTTTTTTTTSTTTPGPVAGAVTFGGRQTSQFLAVFDQTPGGALRIKTPSGIVELALGDEGPVKIKLSSGVKCVQ